MDLEVKVGDRALGIAAVAHVGYEFATFHVLALVEAGGIGVLHPALPVVGAGRVVVDVDVEIVVAVVAPQEKVVPRRPVWIEPIDLAVDHRQ